MKKNLISLFAMMFLALTFAKAQNPSNDCKLKAEFAFKPDNCTVTYSDKSTADNGSTITNWYWSFGDGTSDTTKNPKHIYKFSGHFEVCLTVVGVNKVGKKCKDISCQKVEVKGCGSNNDSTKCHLSVKFDAKVDNCTVSFADHSAAGIGSTITGWYWSFGDGDTSVVQNPSHVYTHNGFYNVCLTVVGKNAAGQVCKDKECHSVMVKSCGNVIDSMSCRLAAIFKTKTDSCTATFADASSAGLGTIITGWHWTFGDGDSSKVQNPTHVYAHDGHYSVCLTITGKNVVSGKECKDKECRFVDVKGCGPDLSICRLNPKFDAKSDSCTVTFTNASTAGAGNTITGYFWSFGDGDSSKVQNPSHVYAHDGHYTVCLTIVGKNALTGKECKDKECRFIDVKGCGPDLSICRLNSKFNVKIDSCTATYTNTSTAGVGNTITGYYWSFGDGSTDSTKNPTHTYKKSGHYSVCLVIEGVTANGQKCKDKECRSVMVKGCGNVIDSTHCKLAAMFKTKTDSCTVTFTDASSTGLGTTITKWYWSFGDGTVDSVHQNPAPHVYAHDGSYLVCLSVVAKNSVSGKECKDKECHFINVKGCGPDLSICRLNSKFETKKSDSCTVGFADHSVAGLGTTITKWYWSFGDGAIDSVKNPSHAYTHDGHYTACLTVVGKNILTGKECKDKECRNIFITGCAPDSSKCKVDAKFDFKKDSTKITFDDQSVTASGTTITKWYWNFGDGTVDSVKNPVHVYAKPGKYKVCLIVVGVSLSGKECKDMACTTVGAGYYKDGIVADQAGRISMLQLFPNPATNVVNVSFKVDVAGQVNITVADIQGRVLAVVQDAYMTTGYHNVGWNVDVHAGWYIVTIKTNDGIEQKQLLIQQK